MSPESAALLKLAESIADGAAVDWEAAETGATAEERAVIRQLRVLSEVAVLHRSLPASPDDWRAPAQSSRRPTTPAIGNWGHLVLLERLGRGTSGEVYRAWDRQLEREVALKLLRTADGADPQVERITREGRLLARVRHPHVITVYGVGVHDGRAGLWMELVRGATLEQTLAARGPFSAREAALIGIDLCRALAAVHAAGLIHRDVKAQNVLREDGGRTVLMDLGTGRETGPVSPRAVDMTGTPLYLAPEILEGGPASARTDIYSAGVLLYRLVTGTFPVRATSIEELHTAHVNGQGVRLRDVRPDLPTPFVSAVDRATAGDPARRQASAGALEADLVRALDAPVRPRRSNWRRIAAFTAMVLAVAGLAAVASPWVRARFAPSAAPIRSIAVLPLANLSGDPAQEYFADGMTDELISTLGRLDGVDVISRTSVMRFKGSTKPLREIAAALGADAVLEGSVLVSRGRGSAAPATVRINARLVHAGTDVQRWSRTFETVVADVLTLQSQVADAVASGIRGRLASPRRQGAETRATAAAPQQDFSAFDLYLRGRYYWNMRTEEGMKRSLQYFQEAVDRDESFARAHAGIADAYSLLGWLSLMPRAEASERATEAASRAIALDGSLGETYASLALAQMARMRWDDAAASFRRAILLAPSYASAHHWYSAYLAQAGRLPEALAEIDRAVSLDPLSISVGSQRGAILLMARRYDEAIGQLEETLRRNPGVPRTHVILADAFALRGEHDRATAEIEQAIASGGKGLELRAHLGFIHASAGRRAEALEIIDELSAAYDRREETAAGGAAAVYAGLGDRQNAIRWLERARVAGDPWILYLKVHPRWDGLRNDSGFERLLATTELAR